MSQNGGSSKKKWRGQSRSKSSNRRHHPQRPGNQGYSTPRGSQDHWHRPDYRGYDNEYSRNFASEPPVIETGSGGGGGSAPGVGIFIAPYYTGFGNAQNSWKSGYSHNGYQNNKAAASVEKCDRWLSSPSTKGGFVSPHRNRPSNGSWSSNGGRSNDRRQLSGNLRNVPYTFDARDDRGRTSYSSRRPTDNSKEGEGSEVSSSVDFERVKSSRSISASKTSGREVSSHDRGGSETGSHSVSRGKVENECRSNSKASSSRSVSKMQNDEQLKVGVNSENSKAIFDKAAIPSLMSLPKVPPEFKTKNGKIASKICTKSPRKKQLNKNAPNIRQKVEPLRVKSDTSLEAKGGPSSSRNQYSKYGTAQIAQLSERTKQKSASVPISSVATQEALQSSEADCRSANAGVRPKVDIVMRKKRSNGLSKENLMKLISSPRSRQEHMQLNRILQAHAEKQKTSMQHATTSETEEHEDVEPSSDTSGFFKEIEVSALPIEIQREIDILCQGITDANPSEHSNNVSVINLSDIVDEGISVSRISPSRNAASNDTVMLQDNAQQDPNGTFVSRLSAAFSQLQSRSSEVLSRASSSDRLVIVEEDSGTLVTPSASRLTCQPSVSRSSLVSPGGTKSCDDISDLPCTAGGVASAAATPSGATSTSSSQRVQSPATASNNCLNTVNESRVNQGGIQSLGTLLQISLREEGIRSHLKETEGAITSLEEQLTQLKEQLSIKLSIKQQLTEEKVRLRSLRLQILKESVGHQQEDSASAVTPVTERLPNVPYESVMEVTSSEVGYNHTDQNIGHAGSGYGFDSVLRDGVINIEPVNDDYESGPCSSEAVCPPYENDDTVRLITIAPTDGGDSCDEDERLRGNSTAAVASGQTPEPFVHPEELGNTVSVHMEYMGTLSTSNLQPEVLQQIALSLQPLDAQRVPFHASCVPGSSVNEFSCSEDETVESTQTPSVSNKEITGPKAAKKKRNVEPDTDFRSQPVMSGSDDCVISKVVKPVSRKSNRGISESEQTTGSAKTAVLSEKSPSRKRSASGEIERAVARAQRLAAAQATTSMATQMASSNTMHDLMATPMPYPQTIRGRPTAPSKLTDVNRLLATVSIGDDCPVRFCDQGRNGAKAAKERCRANASVLQSSADPVAQKRKTPSNPNEPPAKRRKPVENPTGQKKNEKGKRMVNSIYPRAYPGVLYRHVESARSIVLSDEVVITASDDGQIVRHPLPRQVYGLVEKQTFAGHQRGVVGLITAKVQVTRDISRTVALSLGRDQLLKMHCIQTGKVLMTHTFDKSFCYDCICEANDTVYVGLDDGSIARVTTSSFDLKEPFTFLSSSRISALACFADGARSMLLIGFGDCTVSVRDASNNFGIQTLRGHVRPPRFILTLHDRIVSSSGDCCVFVHCLKICPEFQRQFQSNKSFNTLVNTLHLPSPVVAMTIQAKHELLVVACRNRTVTFIDIKENVRYITRLSTIEFPLTCVAASHHMVYFGCNNGMVHHIDVDMTRHWSCGFNGCKDWFLQKSDLEDHIREDHCATNLSTVVNGQSKNICGWHGCKLSISCKKGNQKTLAHFLSHITNLEAEKTPSRCAVTN